MNKDVLITAEKPSRSPGLRGGTPWAFCAVLLLALLIRGGVLLVTPSALTVDTDGYRRLAENLVTHGTFGVDDAPTAYRPPLYPLLLAGCVALGDAGRLAIGVLHVVLGVATVALVWVLGATVGWSTRQTDASRGNPTPPHCNGGAFAGGANFLKTRFTNCGAALAALLVALDPILLAQSALVMTETLAAFLTTAGLVALTWAACRPTAYRAMLAGATLGLGVLCRPTLLPWIVLVAVVLWLRGPGANAGWSSSARDTVGQAHCGTRHSLTIPAAFLLGVLIVLSPWAIRNQLQFGRPIVTTTHGGYTLLVANNPEFYQWLGTGAWGSVWRADRFNADWYQRRPHDELQADRLAYAEAWRNIRRAPGTFFYACVVRLGRFCSPLPHQVVANETPPRPSLAIPGGAVVRDRVLVGGGRLLACRLPSPFGRGVGGEGGGANGREPMGETRGNRRIRFSPFPVPPSALALGFGACC